MCHISSKTKCAPICVGLSHKIHKKYIDVCFYNITKFENLKGYKY